MHLSTHAVTLLISILGPALPTSLADQTVYLESRLGRIYGLHTAGSDGRKGFYSFNSIPYSKSVAGKRRFLPSQLSRSWSGMEHNGTVESPVCPQPNEDGDIVGVEDCLVLNIFVPEDAFQINSHGEISVDLDDDELLAVMVFVHGDDHIHGSGNPHQYGPDLLVDKNVIIITLNYRLGVLGYFTIFEDEAPGNLALWDVFTALEWTNEFIDDYGGSNNLVTLFGSQSGSMIVSALLSKEESKFNRAILQSGTLVREDFNRRADANRVQSYKDFAEYVGCESNNSTVLISCLQDLPFNDLVAATYFDPWIYLNWEPTIDQYLTNSIFPKTLQQSLEDGNLKDVDLIIGSNGADGLYEIKDTYIANVDLYDDLQSEFGKKGPELFLKQISPNPQDLIYSARLRYFYFGESILDKSVENDLINCVTDNFYQSGIRYLINTLALISEKQNIYSYVFNYTNIDLEISKQGPCCGQELMFLFFTPELESHLSSEDKLMRERIVSWWSNFAKSGNPNDASNVWIKNSLSERGYLSIKSTPEMEYYDELREKDNYWKTLLTDPNVDKSSAGLIKGIYLNSVSGKCIKAYHGIPYAVKPIGINRFKDPLPFGDWNGILEASTVKPLCWRYSDDALLMKSQLFSEDCLYLDIYKPCNSDDNLPVIVSFIENTLLSKDGPGSVFGPEYILEKDIVLVNVNYRTSAFGFLSLENDILPGNQGLKDQKLALQWVNEHIESFGGNTNKIILYGEGDGGKR